MRVPGRLGGELSGDVFHDIHGRTGGTGEQVRIDGVIVVVMGMMIVSVVVIVLVIVVIVVVVGMMIASVVVDFVMGVMV